MQDQSPDKISTLVEDLLSHKDDYAMHWLTFWNDLLRNDYRGTGYIDGGRKQISPWLYTALRDNLRFTDRVALFEVAQVYLPKEGEPLPDEPRRLGIVMSGPRLARSWLRKQIGT